MRRGLFGLLALVMACGPEASFEESTPEGASVELRARAGDTSLWVSPVMSRRIVEGRGMYFVTGRASRNIEDGNAFVLDDPYGWFETVSARKYQVGFSISELTNLFVGVQSFTRVGFVESSNRPRSVTTLVVVTPRLTGSSGSGLYLDGQPKVVSVSGRPVARFWGHADRDLVSLTVTAGGVAVPDVALVDARHFTIDLLVDQVGEIAGTSQRLELTGKGRRSTIRRTTGLELAIAKFDATTGDPYEVWPRNVCTTEVAACLASLPPGPADLSSCGTYLEVAACPRGAAVDDASFAAALGRAHVGVIAGLESDANILVGAARREQFLAKVEDSIDQILLLNWRRGFPTSSERDAFLDAEISKAVDGAYTRPLSFVEKVTPIAGDLARIRDLCADSMLEYLSTADLTQSEWARPVDQLTKEFRAQHLAAIQSFREVGEVALETADTTIYTANWLGAHVEVTITKATGAVTYFLFEVD